MFFYLLIFAGIIFCNVLANKECPVDQTVCEYWLTVEERLTMTWKATRVFAENGSLFKWNDKTEVPMDEVITTDGFDRSVITVNNTIPGPPLIVYEGQELVIHVHNRLLSEAITIHWHGLHQKNTPFMDGVAFITQCPISAGQKFTYKFKANPRGTFWYHSHIGGQRVDGLYGALIIKPKPSTNDKNIEEKIMHVGDWFHQEGSELHAKMIYGNFKSQKDFKHPKTLDGVYFAPLIFKSVLIEGRGQYKDPTSGETIQTPLKVYYVKSGEKYRFRVIGAGMIYPFRVSIDNHLLTVVSSDGYDIQPRVFESFIINPGERYDFIITANQTAGNYWIRVDGMEVQYPDHNGRAILSYKSVLVSEPNSTRKNCSETETCLVLNCQFSYYPKNEHTQCTRIDQLDSKDGDATPVFEENSEEHFLNFVQGIGRMVINGKIFEHPGMSALTQPDLEYEKHLDCNRTECTVADANCYCQHELSLSYNMTIQMIWTNHGNGATRHHPIHLHGHSFHVLKMGYANYNDSTGLLVSANDDISCGNTPLNHCNKPTWKNTTWANGNIPGIKIKNAPQKDTLMLPVGAYAVIRFRSDNPGKWFLHCHVEFHSMQGMAMIINEAQDRHQLPPKGFPICQDFHNDANKDKGHMKTVIVKESSDDDVKDVYFILFIIMAVLVVLEFVIIFVLVRKRNAKTHNGNSIAHNANL